MPEDSVPVVEASVSDAYPSLSIHLDPRRDGDVVVSDTFHAPLMVSDVSRWGIARDILGKYEVNGRSGLPPGQGMLDQPKTLNDIIENTGMQSDTDFSQSVGSDTPVVEAVAVLPAAPAREFETNFIPALNIGIHGGNYIAFAVHEDRENRWKQMSADRHELKVMYIDDERELHSWSADYVPAMSDVERLILPSSVGHMIIVAAQYEEERKSFDLLHFSQDSSFGGGFRGGGFGSKGFGLGGGLAFYSMAAAPVPKRAEVGDMKLGKGASKGEGQLFSGELKMKPKAIIYHLRVVGVKPGEVEGFTPEKLEEVAQTLSNYKAGE